MSANVVYVFGERDASRVKTCAVAYDDKGNPSKHMGATSAIAYGIEELRSKSYRIVLDVDPDGNTAPIPAADRSLFERFKK